MLARNPLTVSACWRELTPSNHHYIVGGETMGLVCKVGNVFYAEADRALSLGRQNGKPLQLGRFPSMLAGMTAVQDALESPAGNPASDATALGREAIAADPAPDQYDEDRLRTYDVINGRWVR